MGADASRDGPFLLDAMCGTLATYLRMCGYDAAYALDRDAEADDRLLDLAAAEDRTLLTRDRQLVERAEARGLDAVLLTERDVLDQLRELRAAGVPVDLPETPTRCGRCNGRLERVPVDADLPDYVPDETASVGSGERRPDGNPPGVWRCVDCGRCFWRGSHWDDVAARLADL
ncbi:Mut7-C RNAse domain-containing protein [Haloparvum sedimenti]|uniref:Mut7-C RNAse domain-containing protein n=1 Tax=Haloparvum sedimenti TaxID=1678448 RepID=UPI00071E73C4|nr:Mut7-C RNAse domain-containing protein [Haloparvum sedimenti]